MKTKNFLSMAALALVCLAASCKKDSVAVPQNNNNNNNNNGGGNTTTYQSFSREYAKLAPQTMTKSIDAATGGSFYGYSGTRYVFPANAFQTASGAVVTGSVDLQVMECVKSTDMIFARMLTVSNGKPLLSAGSVMVKATKDGADVYMRPGMTYTVKMPTAKGPSAGGMDYFRGIMTPTDSSSVVNWAPNIDSLYGVIYNGDTIIVTPDSMGYINLDKFAAGDIVEVNVKVDGVSATLTSKDVMGYYLIDGTLSVLPLSASAFSSNTYNGIKMVNSKSHIVVAVISGGDFYGGILSGVTATSGSTYTVTVSKMTPSAFKALVDAL